MVRNSVKAPNYAAAVSENQSRGLRVDRDHQTASLNCNLTFQPDPDRHKNARCQRQLLLLHSNSVTCWTCVRVRTRGTFAVWHSCRPINCPHKIRTIKPHMSPSSSFSWTCRGNGTRALILCMCEFDACPTPRTCFWFPHAHTQTRTHLDWRMQSQAESAERRKCLIGIHLLYRSWTLS